jgi:hypothetical protein
MNGQSVVVTIMIHDRLQGLAFRAQCLLELSDFPNAKESRVHWKKREPLLAPSLRAHALQPKNQIRTEGSG